MQLPVGVKRREVIDKTERLTPQENAESFIKCRITTLKAKLIHESFLLEGETFESIQQEINIYEEMLEIWKKNLKKK